MKVQVLHQTDIFHHHGDPDDHWDLACQFALSYLGESDLKAILVDYPPTADFGGVDCGDPAILAVAQLNYITGHAVPVGIGRDGRIRSDEDVDAIFAQKPLNSGIALVLKMLEEAKEPIVIHIVGSCRDIAAAIVARPELFREKCKAIYLNAGTGYNDEILEYNVTLDAYAYGKLFEAPCPLYWMPCFHDTGVFEVGEYGTYYKFQQKEILPYVSENLQKYFVYALAKVMDPRWLSYLELPVNDKLLKYHGNFYRNMWCTAGFLHMVGKTVTTEGQIVPLGQEGIKPVFDFIPIEVCCDKDGRTNWKPVDFSTDRFVFKVLDLKNYQTAMTAALKQLLMQIP